MSTSLEVIRIRTRIGIQWIVQPADADWLLAEEAWDHAWFRSYSEDEAKAWAVAE